MTSSTADATPTASGSRAASWARMLAGSAILFVLLWRVGAGPFLDGIRMVDGWSLAAAAGIAVVTTVCAAWRWNLVSSGLGARVPLPLGVAAYYRSQFLNMTLPGGVVGDVHRAVRHGRDVGDVGLSMRAVAWERSSGQFVQLVVTIIVLLLLPSPLRSSMPVIATALVTGALAVAILGRFLPHDGTSRWARSRRAAASDIREGLLAARAWPGIVLASGVIVIGHTATFLIAARAAGSTASPVVLLPLALLVLLAMAVPTSIGGWGPREGMAALVFGMAGLGASIGVTTAVVYGVLVLVASLPGAVVLVVVWLRSQTRSGAAPDPRAWRSPMTASGEGTVRG